MGEPSTQHERPCIAPREVRRFDSGLGPPTPACRGHRHRRSHGGWGACILRRSTAPVTALSPEWTNHLRSATESRGGRGRLGGPPKSEPQSGDLMNKTMRALVVGTAAAGAVIAAPGVADARTAGAGSTVHYQWTSDSVGNQITYIGKDGKQITKQVRFRPLPVGFARTVRVLDPVPRHQTPKHRRPHPVSADLCDVQHQGEWQTSCTAEPYRRARRGAERNDAQYRLLSLRTIPGTCQGHTPVKKASARFTPSSAEPHSQHQERR